MNTLILNHCTKCLTSIDLLFKNHALNPEILDEFIYESLSVSMTHYLMIEKTLTTAERNRYQIKHMQVELLLSLLRRLQLHSQ